MKLFFWYIVYIIYNIERSGIPHKAFTSGFD